MKRVGLGFVFFVALVICLYGSLVVGDLSQFWQKPFFVDVHFKDAKGLRKGDDVRVEGVLFGKVHTLELARGLGVNVRLRLDKEIELLSDCLIMVESTSVLGGNMVSVRRGIRPPRMDTTQPIAGVARPGMEAFTELADENRANLKDLIVNLKDITAALKGKDGSIGKAINTPQIHDEVVATLKEAKEAVAEFKKVAVGAEKVLESAGKAVEKIEKGDGPVAKLLNDKKLSEKVDRVVDNVEKVSDNLKQVTEKINKGEGLAGKLINDKEMGENVKKTVDHLEKATDSIKNISRNLEQGNGTVGKLLQSDELYNKAKKTIDDMDKVFGKVARTEVEIVLDTRTYDESMTVTRAGLRVTPSEDKYFFAGAAMLGLTPSGDVLYDDLKDDDDDLIIKPEVYIAYRIPWILDRRLSVRAGMIEGKPGGAVDLKWENWGLFTHPIEITIEARDAYNDLKDEHIDEGIDGEVLRVYAKMPLWTNRETWWGTLLSTVRVYGGVSRIGEDPESFFGIGLEWVDEDVRTLVTLIGSAQ